jgi:predicted site-specific integrase-resolvase
MRAMQSEGMWTQQEVARYLRVSVSTLKRWRKVPGQGPPWVSFAGKPRYEPERVIEWARSQGRERR